ncbi:hypothetical protein KCP73_12365 [Salmonella enterica subsp. enterica]|nr:hypothetical protein KCP73_12365 [Salmonella enterica subsp. enterica]
MAQYGDAERTLCNWRQLGLKQGNTETDPEQRSAERAIKEVTGALQWALAHGYRLARPFLESEMRAVSEYRGGEEMINETYTAQHPIAQSAPGFHR